MKIPGKMGLGRFALMLSLLILVGIALFARFALKTPESEIVYAPAPGSQQAGKSGQHLNETFLQGGVLQRDLADLPPEEFLTVETTVNTPGFETQEFTVHAGKMISVTLVNRSAIKHLHTWVLVEPGSEILVQNLARETESLEHWIPDSPDILAFVPLTAPGESQTAKFRAPQKPGDYPFLCLYPGHGNEMKGILHVIK